ncbi:MAG TPA: P-type conjugative transfer ATPase TrbB [Alphaproteobacteria bacterium]|nr:P-type conjugative transfer ATPase TrbB [Alphaproteobacteria bacterium]
MSAPRLVAGQELRDRQARMLRTAFGPVITAFILDDRVTDILLNPDGNLWVARQGETCRFSGTMISAADGDRIVRLVASASGIEVHARNPEFTAALPLDVTTGAGARFKGLLPPLSTAPSFAIRKPAGIIFPLEDYVSDEILSSGQAAALADAVTRRLNILIAGGTGSGKTTLANALLSELKGADDRVLLLEETPELQCAARNVVSLRTVAGVRSLRDLVRAAMHLYPQRIVVGEVLGAEALDLLKAWNSGHPGGISTIHANSASGALTKLVQFMQEIVVSVPRELIAEAIDLVVFIAQRGGTRRVRAISAVEGWNGITWILRPIESAADLPNPDLMEDFR